MHLGNGAITPGCAAVTFAAAAAGIGAAVQALRRLPVDRNQLAMAGALGGAIFAAQMVNVAVLPFSSAHLVGGVLAAWTLGPALGTVTMAVVITSQALLLGDGGLFALGANIINMALLPAGMAALVKKRVTYGTVGLSAAAAVVGAAALIVGEVTLFRGAEELRGLTGFAGQMLVVHLWIAVPEGLLTLALLLALGRLSAPGRLRLDGTRLAGCWGAALFLILCLLPLASPMPDGYESSAERSGMQALLSDAGGGIDSVSEWNASVAGVQERLVAGLQEVLASGQLLALVTTGLTGMAAWGLARILAGRTNLTSS